MDGAGSCPPWSFGKYVVARHRLRMAPPGRDDMPAELLASWEPAVDAQMFPLCWRRIAGERGHSERFSVGQTGLRSIPKTHGILEYLTNWRPLACAVHCSSSLADPCGPPPRCCRQLVSVQFGCPSGLEPMYMADAIGPCSGRATR